MIGAMGNMGGVVYAVVFKVCGGELWEGGLGCGCRDDWDEFWFLLGSRQLVGGRLGVVECLLFSSCPF